MRSLCMSGAIALFTATVVILCGSYLSPVLFGQQSGFCGQIWPGCGEDHGTDCCHCNGDSGDPPNCPNSNIWQCTVLPGSWNSFKQVLVQYKTCIYGSGTCTTEDVDCNEIRLWTQLDCTGSGTGCTTGSPYYITTPGCTLPPP